MSSPEAITPFKISIPQVDIERLHTRLLTNQIRHPTHDVVPNAGEDYGLQTAWAQNLMDHWTHDYSWTFAQRHMNSFSHYTTKMEDLDIHFIHQKSSSESAIPLLLIHGWPGSFHEFSEVIGPLTSPPSSSDGAAAKQAFHCIVPSLPGFTFSSPPQRRGWTVKDTARVFHTLMLRLGYKTYVVQAGDWGQFVARELGANPAYGARVIHLNWCPGALPKELKDEDLEPRERQARDRGINWRSEHIGYAALMRTRPQSLGWMVEDNPPGLLAFVGEKYFEASNPTVHDTEGWKEHIVTTLCLYYFTRCITSSALVYYENCPHHLFADYVVKEENLIRCPFGYTSYIFDTAPNSRRAVERTGKLVFYNERDYAGHFACLEDPKGVCEDLREVVAKHWEKKEE